MALSEDTELQVVEPLRVLASVEIAEQLQAGRGLTPLELAVNHFHPDRYSYRIQLRTRLDHPAAPPAGPGSR